MILGFSIIIFVVSVIPIGVIMAAGQNDSKNFWLYPIYAYLKIPKRGYIGTYYSTHPYSCGYAVIWLPIIIAYIIKKTFNTLTIDAVKKHTQRKKERLFARTQFIQLDAIYEFKPGDKIRMKSGDIRTLHKFSASQFVDTEENILNWIDAHENITYKKRKEHDTNTIRLAVFDKEADTFMDKVKQFEKEYDRQKKSMIDKIKE